MEPEIELLPDGESVRLFGIVYSLALFRVFAAKLPPGTHVDVMRKPGGKIDLYHFTPRRPGTP